MGATWTKLPNANTPFSSRFGSSMTWFKGRIFMAGGSTTTAATNVNKQQTTNNKQQTGVNVAE